MKLLDFLFGFRQASFPLNTDSLPITDLDIPEKLSIALNNVNGDAGKALVSKGDSIQAGQPIWGIDKNLLQVSPVNGKVADIVNVPEIRGNRITPSIIIEPDTDSTPIVLPPLNKEKESDETLKSRLVKAGVLTDHLPPQPILDVLCPEDGNPAEAVVILAIDREPELSVFAQLFRDRSNDVIQAAQMMGRISGTKKVFVALPQYLQSEAAILRQADTITPIFIPPKYPESIDALIANQTGLKKDVKTISIETALVALDAIRKGQIQDKKVLTVIGPDAKAMGNYRVALGTRISDVFSALGLKPGERDKVVAGGPMRGFAQYSLDGAIDYGTNALMLIPESSVIKWNDDPCINCGKCIYICPVNLQVNLIGRYSEFNLFDRTREFDIDECIECGLCACVCTAGRPLMQLIDLAKSENKKADNAEQDIEVSIPPSPQLSENDPALSIFSGIPKFIVGFAPHWRTRDSITKMNLAFIFMLLSVVMASAISTFFDPDMANLSAVAAGPVSSFVKVLLYELGLKPNFIWFISILGTAIFGLSFGMLSEYGCQVLMRQPYHAFNGHGALMGLLVAMLMPPTVPVWVLAIAIITAIFIGKQVFGGIGGYPMHPALVGWLVILLSWPQYINPIGTSSIAALHPSAVIITALVGIILCLSGHIRFEIPVGVIIGVVAFSFIFQTKLDGSVIDQLLTGHVMLAAFFLASDSTSSPANIRAMWIYGVGVGFAIMLIRAFGIQPDAVPFAILLMNILFPLIDRLKPKVIKGAI